MSDGANQRQAAFARFIRRAVDGQLAMGLKADEIATKTGVKKSTWYRWIREETLPQPEQLRRFSRGLGIPEDIGPSILGWIPDQPGADEEPGLDPDVLAVARRLKDPEVSRDEKNAIRQMLRYLARGGAAAA